MQHNIQKKLNELNSVSTKINDDSLNQKGKLKQNELVRLDTFKGKIIKLSKLLLAKNGFICDENILRCSGCTYKTNDLTIELSYLLFTDHLKYIENNKQISKCTFYEIQKKYVNYISKDVKADRNLFKEEKLPNKFEKFELRLETFEIKPLEIDGKELAENGMLLVDDPNICQNVYKLKCYFCNYECFIFNKGHLNNYYEKPSIDHFKKSSYCEIVRKKMENKIEIDRFKEENLFLSLQNNNETITPFQYNTNGNSNFDLVKSILHKSANASCDKPYHSGYATEQSRLDSFREWSTNLVQHPNDLSKAGFYYYGLKDMVKCFYCNGGLRNWDPIDEPLVEHARWFPKCSYIRQLRGEDFIEQVRERYKDLDNGFKDDYDDTPEYYDVVNNDSNSIDSKSNSGNIKKRPISPRTINSRMDLPSIKKIMALGFTRNVIKQVIENKLSESGNDFENYVELTRACFKLKENSKSIEKQFQDAFHLYISNITMNITYKSICDEFRKSFDVVPLLINKIIDSSNASFGILLIRLKEDDVRRCDEIVNFLNEKPFPGSDSKAKIIVKKTKIEELKKPEYLDKLNEMDKESTNFHQKESQKKDNDDLTKNNKIDSAEINNEELAEEIENLKKERSCSICFERQKVIMFMPCSHLATCVECSVALTKCPICRKKVQATIRTYI